MKSFDFLRKAPGREFRVEVKGTTGLGQSVIVTANEVAVAREQFPNVGLYVVSGIMLASEDGRVVGCGGQLARFEPWNVTAHLLEPLAFRCLLAPEPGDA